MNIEITANPVFRLPLTAFDVALMRELAAAHYDGKCKAAGVVGGFLYGWANVLSTSHEESDTPVTVGASRDDMHLMLKIMEMGSSGLLHGRIADFMRAQRLSLDIGSAIFRWNLISHEWRTEIDTTQNGVAPHRIGCELRVTADDLPKGML